ncbi:hypothetical protein L873DRAFT_1788808 [Choiromyces venosus 120613-1]|uniref:Uncharacterized protein n=1 Tax=Choiromyces venosus 120613-1 TaxID=1336337 RepID=A0A3N4JUU5_9PEZI|nr:hypothetical protein L873DRAFT_1788808 [Choiromyces venosus 120613-1]
MPVSSYYFPPSNLPINVHHTDGCLNTSAVSTASLVEMVRSVTFSLMTEFELVVNSILLGSGCLDCHVKHDDAFARFAHRNRTFHSRKLARGMDVAPIHTFLKDTSMALGGGRTTEVDGLGDSSHASPLQQDVDEVALVGSGIAETYSMPVIPFTLAETVVGNAPELGPAPHTVSAWTPAKFEMLLLLLLYIITLMEPSGYEAVLTYIWALTSARSMICLSLHASIIF